MMLARVQSDEKHQYKANSRNKQLWSENQRKFNRISIPKWQKTPRGNPHDAFVDKQNSAQSIERSFVIADNCDTFLVVD